MKKTICSLLLIAACGCSSSQLAKDEAAALAGAQKLDAVISSGSVPADIQQASSSLLAIDPSSPILQRLDSNIQSAKTVQAVQDAGIATKGVIVLLKTQVAAAAPAPVSGN